MKIDFAGHRLAAIDFETTGVQPGYHEPVEIAIIPLDETLRPCCYCRPFHSFIRPLRPDRADPAAMAIHRIPLDVLLAAPTPGDVADPAAMAIHRIPLDVLLAA